MSAKFLYLDKFGKAFVPNKFRPYLKDYFRKAGYEEAKYTWFGILFWISAAVTYLVYVPFIYPEISDAGPLMFFAGTFVSWAMVHGFVAALLGLLMYFWLDLKIYKRTKNLEEKLPDYLNLVSVNLKGGMSFEEALWAAIKPEFEVLAKEITIVSKSVMTGNDVKEALQNFSRKYDSPILRRSIDLLVGEIEGGGRIVNVIDSLVDNLKKTEALRRELQVATRTYMIFMAAIVVLIAPALFAVSYQLLQMITDFTANLGGNMQNISLPVSFGESAVPPEQFKTFSYFALGVISGFSSMIVSIIEKGDIKGGLKYLPMFVAGSLTLYFVFSEIMIAVFSGFGG